MANPNWPRDIFGVDLNKAVPQSIELIGGYPVRRPSLTNLPDNAANILGAPTIVTTSSYTILPTDYFIVISRNAPTTTALTLPSSTSRNGIPLFIADWSTNVTEHVITLTPNGVETIMKQSTWQMVSNAAQLTSGTFFPTPDLPGWTTAP